MLSGSSGALPRHDALTTSIRSSTGGAALEQPDRSAGLGEVERREQASRACPDHQRPHLGAKPPWPRGLGVEAVAAFVPRLPGAHPGRLLGEEPRLVVELDPEHPDPARGAVPGVEAVADPGRGADPLGGYREVLGDQDRALDALF